jgi:hypothetical protein
MVVGKHSASKSDDDSFRVQVTKELFCRGGLAAVLIFWFDPRQSKWDLAMIVAAIGTHIYMKQIC